MNKPKQNHLRGSTSPYLLQHVNNPVDWYPWGEAALKKAQQEDKPILLSIGYSACHWCHVMAHESFEDEETAKLMNELFINIKVDREERPDLDKIYQAAHQLLAQRPGGWPLTVFLTPEKQIPFFAGTYFPPRAGFGRPSFKEVLKYIADTYHTHKDEITKQNESLINVFSKITPPASKQELNLSPVKKAFENIVASFDEVNGGFGKAPKFPLTNYLELLLRQYAQNKDEASLEMVVQTLTKMAQGGIYDQLGGGFFRYSVDAEWQIPHFEKMLYDNALLLTIYVEAYALTEHTLFAEIAKSVGEWVIREMQSSDGGYYATLDADTEGEEGKFYLWDKLDVEKLLTPDEFKIVAAYYNLDQAANFEGHWHLHVVKNLDELADQLKLPEEEIEIHLQSAKQKLFQARAKRTYPHRDEKILTAWNALMIKAMAMAGMYLERKDFISSAKRAMDFINKNMWQKKQLSSSYKDQQTINGYLDDYVFLMDSLLTLLEVEWNNNYSNFLLELAEVVLQDFQDKVGGGFYFTSDQHETLFYRPKNIIDEALPSGNGIAALVFNRLGYFVGEKRYITAAEQTLKMAGPSMEKYPEACVTLLLALQEFLQPPEIIIIRGKPTNLFEWQRLCQQYYSPTRLVFAIADNMTDLPEFLLSKKAQENTIVYICKGFECLTPMTNISEFETKLH